MDPLSCLSVAGTVVQFIDFAFRILSESQKLYESGELAVHVQTRRLVEDLADYSILMQRSIRADGDIFLLTPNELELEKACQECAVIANDLSTRLAKFTVSDKHKVWKSVGQALKSMWAKKELEALEKKLSKYRDMMNSRLLGSLRERVIALHEHVYGQTAVINNRTEELIANVLLETHACYSRGLRTQARLLTEIVNGATPDYGSLCLEVKQPEEAEIYKSVQQIEARLCKEIAEELLESLRYDKFRERFEALAEAHKETLEWIFESPSLEDDVQWSDFVQWLREGDGIYWINGKAGSGKSTLMKYIIEHKSTKEHLMIWAKDTPLHAGTFFFWWAGTKIQRSQEGLLRSLLYDILRKVPSLIPVVLPSQYADRYAAKTNLSKTRPVESWSLGALSKAFQTLLFQTELPMKMCLFIDGLDEYDGLEVDIAQVFKDASLSSHIKICVSSRPHVPFEDAFATRPKLKLDSLTHHDIKLYVTERLENNVMMQKLAEQEPQQCQSLAWEIAHAAQGVFVWVIIVVNSLIRGLSNHDQITTLQRRLRAYPRDLDELYRQMVTRVDEFYAEEASDIFQLVGAATDQPDDDKNMFPNHLSLLGLHLAMKKDLDLSRELKEMSFNPKLVEEEGREVDVMVKTRCGGLIETEYRGPDGPDFSPFMRVFYMHRTVRDFLMTPETQRILLSRTGGRGAFKPNVAIFKSIVLQMKAYSPRKCLQDPLGMQALLYARRIDADINTPVEEVAPLFDEFFTLMGLTELSLKRYVESKVREKQCRVKEELCKAEKDVEVQKRERSCCVQ